MTNGFHPPKGVRSKEHGEEGGPFGEASKIIEANGTGATPSE